MVLISAHLVEIAVVGGNAHAAVGCRQFLPLRKPPRTVGFIRQRFMGLLLLFRARLVAELADQVGRVCLEVRPLLGMAVLGP